MHVKTQSSSGAGRSGDRSKASQGWCDTAALSQGLSEGCSSVAVDVQASAMAEPVAHGETVSSVAPVAGECALDHYVPALDTAAGSSFDAAYLSSDSKDESPHFTGASSSDFFQKKESAPALDAAGVAAFEWQRQKVQQEAQGLWGELPAVPDSPELVHLRDLLFQREIALVNRLKERLDSPDEHARDVGQVVTEALLLRMQKDDLLPQVLAPVVTDTLKVALRRSPTELALLIFPLMGPAIRRSIASSLRSMLESFNRSVELAFSWKGIKWRLEALRTGKPFSDVVLLHTLVYRVEQVFFIHSETGLVLGHEVHEGVDTQDADMVSAMLTALQQFVKDCFASGDDSELASIQWGDATILIETNPYASLACIVRGTPPADYRANMRDVLDLLLIEFSDALRAFNGDTKDFIGAERFLQECLSARFSDEERVTPLWIKAVPIVCMLLLAGGIGYWQYSKNVAAKALAGYEQEMNSALDVLRAEPGLLVMNVKGEGREPWQIFILRDEHGRTPDEILHAWKSSFDPERFVFRTAPYISYDPGMVTRRVSEKITLPSSVRMQLLDDGTVTFTGTAPIEWMLTTRQLALSTPGVKAVNMEKLVDPRMQEIQLLVSSIEKTVVEFPLGKDTPVPHDAPKLQQAIDALAQLESLARGMGLSVNLVVYGHADRTGVDTRNYEISQSRAKLIAAMLYAKGSSMPVALYGMGAEYAHGDRLSGDQGSRRIELRVHLAQTGSAALDILMK